MGVLRDTARWRGNAWKRPRDSPVTGIHRGDQTQGVARIYRGSGDDGQRQSGDRRSDGVIWLAQRRGVRHGASHDRLRTNRGPRTRSAAAQGCHHAGPVAVSARHGGPAGRRHAQAPMGHPGGTSGAEAGAHRAERFARGVGVIDCPVERGVTNCAMKYGNCPQCNKRLPVRAGRVEAHVKPGTRQPCKAPDTHAPRAKSSLPATERTPIERARRKKWKRTPGWERGGMAVSRFASNT